MKRGLANLGSGKWFGDCADQMKKEIAFAFANSVVMSTGA